MSLFEVPGWSIPNAPVKEQSNKANKKRKHSSAQDQGHVQSVDKFLAKLLNNPAKVEASVSDVGKPKERRGAVSPPEENVMGHSPSSRIRKARKKQRLNRESPTKNVSDVSPASLTTLQRAMKESLGGARFRYVNRYPLLCVLNFLYSKVNQ